MILENELLKLAAARIVQRNLGDQEVFDKKAGISPRMFEVLPWILTGAFGISGGLSGVLKNILGGLGNLGGGGGNDFNDTMQQMMQYQQMRQQMNQDRMTGQKDTAAGVR